MNWMFWKKRIDAGSDAETALEDAGDADELRVPPEDEVTGQEEIEVPEDRGTMMRLKEWFAASAHGFKKTEASDGEADTGDETPSHKSHAPHDTHKPSGHDGADRELAEDEPQPDNAGLAARIKAQFAALAQRFRKKPSADEGEEENEPLPTKEGRGKEIEPEDVPQEADATPPRSSRKYLLVIGVVALVLMSLAGSGFVIWKVFFTRPVQYPVTPGIVEPPRPAPLSMRPEKVKQAEIEALRKKNEELQAQIEALQRQPAPVQQAPAQPSQTRQPVYSGAAATGGSAQASGSAGLAVDAKDPKSAAQGLKEAIEAMNAANGDAGKPRK
ncbi:MAG: hypothetical protein A2Z95_09545 [Gallionellales bacterium GWA2_60_18]|nr:MAG: hypothetical protein A2Z95_09545 [Gallionellales bacterium GWA2_60_18]